MKVFIKKTCWILSNVIFVVYRHEHVVFLFGIVKWWKTLLAFREGDFQVTYFLSFNGGGGVRRAIVLWWHLGRTHFHAHVDCWQNSHMWSRTDVFISLLVSSGHHAGLGGLSLMDARGSLHLEASSGSRRPFQSTTLPCLFCCYTWCLSPAFSYSNLVLCNVPEAMWYWDIPMDWVQTCMSI